MVLILLTWVVSLVLLLEKTTFRACARFVKFWSGRLRIFNCLFLKIIWGRYILVLHASLQMCCASTAFKERFCNNRVHLVAIGLRTLWNVPFRPLLTRHCMMAWLLGCRHLASKVRIVTSSTWMLGARVRRMVTLSPIYTLVGLLPQKARIGIASSLILLLRLIVSRTVFGSRNRIRVVFVFSRCLSWRHISWLFALQKLFFKHLHLLRRVLPRRYGLSSLHILCKELFKSFWAFSSRRDRDFIDVKISILWLAHPLIAIILRGSSTLFSVSVLVKAAAVILSVVEISLHTSEVTVVLHIFVLIIDARCLPMLGNHGFLVSPINATEGPLNVILL